MPLQHQLRSPILIPELHTTILRARDDPLAIMRDGHREHIVLVAREVEHALAEPLAGFTGITDSGVELPVLECSCRASRTRGPCRRRKRDRVDRVAVPAEAVDERARRNVPDAHDGVERARGDEARVGRDGHARHARVDVGIVVDREHLRLACVHVPYPRRLVARARDDERAVVRKVERVDFLLVAFERVPDAFAGDIPYLWRGNRVNRRTASVSGGPGRGRK
jgi:hypothetical protein